MTFTLQQGQLLRLKQPIRLSIVEPGNQGTKELEKVLETFVRNRDIHSYLSKDFPSLSNLNGSFLSKSKFFLAGSIFLVLENKTVISSLSEEDREYSLSILLNDLTKYSFICESSKLSQVVREIA